MRIVLAAVGKLKAGPDRELFERYWERLLAYGRKLGIVWWFSSIGISFAGKIGPNGSSIKRLTGHLAARGGRS